MPQYSFENPETGEVFDVVLGIHENHSTFNKDGIECKRIFQPPQLSVDTNWNCDDSKDFVNKTAAKKGTLGNLWEKANELSEKREKIYGSDPIKEESIKKAKELRHGRVTPQEFRERRQKGMEIDFKLPKK